MSRMQLYTIYTYCDRGTRLIRDVACYVNEKRLPGWRIRCTIFDIRSKDLKTAKRIAARKRVNHEKDMARGF